MADLSNVIAALWRDVLSAVENKHLNPASFNRYYMGKVDACPSTPIHRRKCTKRSITVRRDDQFSLSQPLLGISLTRRELQVLYLICTGCTNKEAADLMGLSPRTAEYYIKNMRKKIDATSKSHLIQLVIATDFLRRVDKSVIFRELL